ncbi:uncharacterized protein LOC119837930 isoform X2 [Zerene cesonia]|nr:uncharacterized protein LOC119837930 isoform X2 [Zerene cesonia]
MRCPEFISNSDPSSSLSKLRCSHCCLEWKRKTKCRIKSKLSKKQKQRIKASTDPKKKNLLNCDQLEKICSFCGHVTSIVIPKFNRKYTIKKQEVGEKVEKQLPPDKKLPIKKQKVGSTKRKDVLGNTKTLNVYSSTSDIFSLKHDNNKLQPSIKHETIKNNKKKKDKFAGLCQQAVLASAKIKQAKDKNNKLNLFLKPSV